MTSGFSNEKRNDISNEISERMSNDDKGNLA